MRKKKKKKKKNLFIDRSKLLFQQDRGDGGPPRSEYRGLNDDGSPDNRTGVPPSLSNVSERPDTLAWVKKHCQFKEDIFIRYVRSNGTGLMNQRAYNLDRLDDDEEQELTELLTYGLVQPPGRRGLNGIPDDAVFAFTQEGVEKHQRLIELLTKAADDDVDEIRFNPYDYKVIWESNDGQVALLPLDKG
jgi:hypothetical protein